MTDHTIDWIAFYGELRGQKQVGVAGDFPLSGSLRGAIDLLKHPSFSQNKRRKINRIQLEG
jgi:hypothetical protein